MRKDIQQDHRRRPALRPMVQASLALAALLALGANCCLAQADAAADTQSALPPVSEGAIHLVALDSASVYDFGLVRAGTITKHTFTVRNDMTVPVVLDRAAPSCHCTGALLLPTSEGGMRLAPGQTAQVQVTLDTQEAAAEADPQGRVTKTVSVYVAGQPIHPAVVLTFTGRIVSGAAFDPPVLDFGTIPTGRGTHQTVRLFFASHTDRLTAVGDDRLYLRRLDTASTTSGIQSYQVGVLPQAAAGPLNAAIAVVGNAAPTATLPVLGQIAGKVSARPSSLVFGIVPAEAAPQADTARRTRWVLLTCPNLQSLRIATFWNHATIQSSSPDWQAAVIALGSPPYSASALRPPDWALGTSATGWLRVTLLPTAPTGQWLSTQITLTFPSGDRLIVPVAGENALPVASDPPKASPPKDAHP